MPGDLILLTNHLSECIVTADHIKVWTDKDPILSRVMRLVQVGSLSVQTLFHISRMKASFICLVADLDIEKKVQTCTNCQINCSLPLWEMAITSMVKNSLGFCGMIIRTRYDYGGLDAYSKWI